MCDLGVIIKLIQMHQDWGQNLYLMPGNLLAAYGDFGVNALDDAPMARAK